MEAGNNLQSETGIFVPLLSPQNVEAAFHSVDFFSFFFFSFPEDSWDFPYYKMCLLSFVN